MKKGYNKVFIVFKYVTLGIDFSTSTPFNRNVNNSFLHSSTSLKQSSFFNKTSDTLNNASVHELMVCTSYKVKNNINAKINK